MTSLMFASAMALFRATLSSQDPLFATDPTAAGPHPANGIWAALPADCLDLSQWPACATPVGFLDGEIAALQRPGPNAKASSDQYYSVARTHFWIIKGSPDIVQVDVPIMFSHSTIYIALTPDAVDDAGGFVAATGWPVGCPPGPVDGVTPLGSRCLATTADAVRAAAQMTPDPAKVYRLVRVTASAAPTLGTAPTPGTGSPPETAPSAPVAGSAPSTPPTARPGEVEETPLEAPPASGPSAPPTAGPPAPHTAPQTAPAPM
jgi:hypothetical protein